jgi:uncharacterized protein (TIGR04255 family)
MVETDRNLPDFATPPIIEVVLSVQFDRLARLGVPQIGQLWAERFKDRFPKTEEHAPLPSVLELFGLQAAPRVDVRLETAQIPRCWFLNQSGTELMQIQPDRFIHNWRKVGKGDEYPRFEHVRDEFHREVSAFRDYLAQEDLGALTPNQCEVTYINHIESGAEWDQPGQLEKVLTVWASRYSDDYLSEPENVRFVARYVIRDSTGDPMGRLHVSAEPAYRAIDGRPVLVLELTARGRPDGEGINGVLAFMNTGREVVVRAFASITTPEMHEIWGRRDER